MTNKKTDPQVGKHTSGDWKVMPGKSAPRICVDGDKDWPIVVAISGHSSLGIEANERLIAAAPELLKAVAKIRDIVARDGGRIDCVAGTIKAADLTKLLKKAGAK